MPCKGSFATQPIPNLLKFTKVIIQTYIQENMMFTTEEHVRKKESFCSLIILVKEESLTISFLLICAKPMLSF